MTLTAVRAHARAGRGLGRGATNPPSPSPPAPARSQPLAGPLPEENFDRGHRYTLAQRIQCLTLLVEGFPGREIERRTGVTPSSQSRIKKKGFERGFRPEQDPRILEH